VKVDLDAGPFEVDGKAVTVLPASDLAKKD
jgi:hypothetical protein